MVERPTRKYAVQTLLAPAGACVEPSLRKKLKLFNLVPLGSPSPEQHENLRKKIEGASLQRLRQKIEGTGPSDASKLWECNDFAFVAETKAKTIELRNRTLELFRKADDAGVPDEVPDVDWWSKVVEATTDQQATQEEDSAGVAMTPKYSSKADILPILVAAVPQTTSQDEADADRPVDRALLETIEVNIAAPPASPAVEGDADEDETGRHKAKMREIRGSMMMMARLKGADITKEIRKELKKNSMMSTARSSDSAAASLDTDSPNATRKKQTRFSLMDADEIFEVRAIQNQEEKIAEEEPGESQSYSYASPSTPSTAGAAEEEGSQKSRMRGKLDSQSTQASEASCDTEATGETDAPTSNLQRRLQKRRTLELVTKNTDMGPTLKQLQRKTTGSLAFEHIVSEGGGSSERDDAGDEDDDDDAKDDEDQEEQPPAARAASTGKISLKTSELFRKSLTVDLKDDAPVAKVKSLTDEVGNPISPANKRRITIARLGIRRSQTAGSMGTQRHTIQPLATAQDERKANLTRSSTMGLSRESGFGSLLLEITRTVSYPSDRPERKGKHLGQQTREGKVRLYRANVDDTLTLEIYFSSTTRRKERAFERTIEQKELEEILQWGRIVEKKAEDRWAWLCNRAYVRHTNVDANGPADKSCVGLRGFDDYAVRDRDTGIAKDTNLANEMHDMLKGLRERRYDEPTGEEYLKQQELKMNQVKLAAARQCLDDEVAVALHDWYERENINENLDMLIFLNKICRASGRPEVDDEMLRRCSRTGDFEGFVQFIDVLCLKFPQIQDMSAWDIRLFAQVVDNDDKDSQAQVSKKRGSTL